MNELKSCIVKGVEMKEKVVKLKSLETETRDTPLTKRAPHT